MVSEDNTTRTGLRDDYGTSGATGTFDTGTTYDTVGGAGTTGYDAAPSYGGESESGGGMSAGAQEAARKAREAAGTAAEKLPSAVASAQSAMNETARTLEEMPDQTLMLGTTFSLGLGVGMFLTGTNRLLVLLAMIPAAAMAATLFGRGNRSTGGL